MPRLLMMKIGQQAGFGKKQQWAERVLTGSRRSARLENGCPIVFTSIDIGFLAYLSG